MKNIAHISAAAQMETKIVLLSWLGETERDGKDGQKSGAAVSLLLHFSDKRYKEMSFTLQSFVAGNNSSV